MTLKLGSWVLGLGSWVVLSLPASRIEEHPQANAVVDEATLAVTRKGERIGREAFRIIRAAGAGGQVYRAVGNSALGDIKLTSVLSTDSLGAPVSYELNLTQGGLRTFLQGRGRPDRFSVLAQTKRGEANREYLMRKSTVLFDDEVIHQLYFVALAALASPDSSVNLISPLGASEGRYRVDFKGIESVAVGGQSLTGRHFTLTDGALVRAEIWIDAAGRLLKATVPDKGLVAQRDDPPR